MECKNFDKILILPLLYNAMVISYICKMATFHGRTNIITHSDCKKIAIVVSIDVVVEIFIVYIRSRWYALCGMSVPFFISGLSFGFIMFAMCAFIGELFQKKCQVRLHNKVSLGA